MKSAAKNGKRNLTKQGQRSAKNGTTPMKPPRPLKEMTPGGRKLWDLAVKAHASGEKKLTLAQIEKEVIRRRGGILS
jgi:hypothetical protein